LRTIALISITVAAVLAASAARAENPVVRMVTPLGDIEIELCNEISTLCLGVAPNSVANFLSYVDSGAYEGSFIHRAVSGFVNQGGSFKANGVSLPETQVQTQAPIASEFNQSNLRGTVSIPLPGASQCDTEENAGTSGWFINLSDANAALDCGLFTVFGVVRTGMDVADAINLRFRVNWGLGPTPVTADYVCAPIPPSTGCTTDPVPWLIYTDITRVPEASAALQSLSAALALARLARRRKR
jgi:peptidyl-prolyl cis-trans isomerase A (cyclophilin A)